MKQRLVRLIRYPWYPLCFSVYPVLALLSHNIAEVKYTAGLRALAISFTGALVLFLLLRLLMRDIHHAAFACLLLVLLFFSYGHVYNLIGQKWKISRLTIWTLTTWLILAVLAFIWATRRSIHFERGAVSLNLISFGLVTVLVVQIVYGSVPRVMITSSAERTSFQNLTVPAGQTPPDIYYIILDSYGRADLLQQSYGFNNTPFIQHLEDLGFYVAKCSQSNYVRTELSLGSSLNMDYLQNLSDQFAPDSILRRPLWDAIRYSAVRLSLENAGYKTVAFATGYAWSEIDDADVYLTPPPLQSGITEFEALLIDTSLVRVLEDVGVLDSFQITSQRFRERTLYDFDSFDNLAHMPGPKFVFIHIIPPHPPFVFGPNGEGIDARQFLNEDHKYPSNLYAEGYQSQLAYINRRIEEAVAFLLAESPAPPVIIIQGDHAPWLQTGSNRFKILNAYYLPGHADLLYPTISPVNTFRLVLDTYLDGHYPLLEDFSYDSPVPKIYDFKPVENSCMEP